MTLQAFHLRQKNIYTLDSVVDHWPSCAKSWPGKTPWAPWRKEVPCWWGGVFARSITLKGALKWWVFYPHVFLVMLKWGIWKLTQPKSGETYDLDFYHYLHQSHYSYYGLFFVRFVHGDNHYLSIRPDALCRRCASKMLSLGPGLLMLQVQRGGPKSIGVSQWSPSTNQGFEWLNPNISLEEILANFSAYVQFLATSGESFHRLSWRAEYRMITHH